MPSFYQKITDEYGAVEDLIRKIPGFSGYLEKQDRRDADRLLREQLVRGLEERHTRYTHIQRSIIDSGGITYMEKLASIDTKLQTFIDRVDSAAQGYAGLFDAVKIKEDALARVYAFDNALFAYLEQLDLGLQALEESIHSENITEVMHELDQLVIEANDTFKRRVEAMQGLNEAV